MLKNTFFVKIKNNKGNKNCHCGTIDFITFYFIKQFP